MCALVDVNAYAERRAAQCLRTMLPDHFSVTKPECIALVGWRPARWAAQYRPQRNARTLLPQCVDQFGLGHR